MTLNRLRRNAVAVAQPPTLVITNVGVQIENAVGLVYVAAMAPDEGEAMLDVAADYPKTKILDSPRYAAKLCAGSQDASTVRDPC